MVAQPTAPPAARVLNIQRMSTEDGPGIRTTVFFKGCSLRCRWCHNPESLSRHPQILWNERLCMGCDTCIEGCPHQALRRAGSAGIVRDPDRCQQCGRCVDECPTEAMERVGDTRPVDELVAAALRDRPFFESSSGGVTLSGGEPAMQPEAARAFLRGCRSQGVHVALDTAGLCARQTLLDLAAEADLVLFDLKAVDPELHRRLTGQRSERILENLERLLAQDVGRPAIWIRTPLIPGDTDTDSNLGAIAAWLAAHPTERIARWELCAFNPLCADKYRRQGRFWPYDGVRPQDEGTLRHIEAVARESGLAPDRVRATGAGRATP